MEQQIPNNFGEFCDELLKCGFSLGGGSKGIYAIIPYDWKEQEFLDYPAKWHTGDPETDPWEWRMRVLEERSEFAYAKVFFGVSGYITKEWYPYFLSVRRKGKSFEEAYNDGEISQTAKRIYDLVSDNGRLAVHEIKQLGGLEKCKDFDKSLTELQMKMYLTMCGRAPKLNIPLLILQSIRCNKQDARRLEQTVPCIPYRIRHILHREALSVLLLQPFSCHGIPCISVARLQSPFQRRIPVRRL